MPEELKSKFPELYQLLFLAVEHGQGFWDSYYGPTEKVLHMFLEEDNIQRMIDGVIEHGNKIQVP